MRERKFKAWIKSKKKMINVSQINFTRKNVSDEFFNYYDFDDIELIEYVGKEDKNVFPIYEGDIVECDGETCTVAWSDYYLAYTLNCKEFGYDNLGDFESKYLEVIGNIYENPELLEEM